MSTKGFGPGARARYIAGRRDVWFRPTSTQVRNACVPNTLTAIQIINGTTFSTANLVPGIANQLAAARSGNGETPSLGMYTRTFDAKLNPWLLTVSVGREF